MKVELFPFQKRALADIRMKTAEALGSYHRTHAPQVVSFTAPTGAGKTIIMASLIESIFFGDENYSEQQNAVVIWLSDSPQLNEQSKLKIDSKADKIRLGQCVTVTEDSFDKEFFEDGYVYFLNTQKLSKTSNLTKNGDGRSYNIWDTLTNTVREKSDRLYFIIDEAHRGMQGSEAGKATTIMQKFIKGSDEDKIPPVPVVIGMSATTQRFNTLIEGTSSTIHKSVVSADEVRASGLLKERIVITYPEEGSVNNDMAILQAAADDWKEKWDHWHQYCYEQHYAYVNPVFVIQVLNGSGNKISDTDLDDCVQKIEERTGFRFETGQVVHTFGQTNASLPINGIEVRYEEPSRISDDRNIRVVFFKENLSTGWDCPHAETMMSFKHANDATYIAQLLGRMVRTPMQMHIQVDDVLNDVHLYLPYFNESTVKDVVEALQSAEGGDIPTDIYGETITGKKFETLTVKPRKKKEDTPVHGQLTIDIFSGPDEDTPIVDVSHDQSAVEITSSTGDVVNETNSSDFNIQEQDDSLQLASETQRTDNHSQITARNAKTENSNTTMHTAMEDEYKQEDTTEDLFDREAVMKFINDAGLLSYTVRAVRINNYLNSLFKMAHLLTMSGSHREAIREVQSEIAQMIHDYVENLKAQGAYDDLVLQVKEFKLATQIFDAFGETIDNYSVHDLFTTTDTDIDRQFRVANVKLGNEGIGMVYGNKYMDINDPSSFKVDVILFVADDECMNKLHNYAQKRFHGLNDDYRRYIATIDSDKIRRQYDSIVSDGDIVSKHNFRLPETIQVPHEDGGKEYMNHLFVNNTTGMAKLKLNSWEAGVIEEEEKRDDFVCWIRNPSRGSWALCIPYEIDGETKPTFPDFIVVRKDDRLGYVIDLLEPHNPDFKDNLGKAKGFAEYARQNPGVGRIQMIRMSKDAAGKNKFKRLDMSKSSIRDKVSHTTTTDELDHIFDTDGFFL
ncbi:TPA: DEAD/DEAH box helicase [Clostridium botulinum]|uniref:Restriction endonuclease subunit R n=3 Tax=Clostridium botulinum TaxID=1491 RepID=A0A6B4FUV3_CLOBO|nr:DEAD/DEAH box helicase family protein [Clostridium botulinum]EPS56090.1 type III restriction protein res subunit [Clostridium botulinum Af84]MBN3350363.1 restriction endonuclease subunit R [Clostridium botulinum]MBN3357399.1 restriction endonuclease subunit R [Clostridium botulinum]MBN3368754.1 restriction endonuclease subunit R [Clostridium botulinum]MBN3376184.1 restriction endonuclease subunit R [Clostridium botulinum]